MLIPCAVCWCSYFVFTFCSIDAGIEAKLCVVYMPHNQLCVSQLMYSGTRSPVRYDAQQNSFEPLTDEDTFALREACGFAKTEAAASKYIIISGVCNSTIASLIDSMKAMHSLYLLHLPGSLPLKVRGLCLQSKMVSAFQPKPVPLTRKSGFTA